jgi:AraC family transcriptional regulator
MIETNPSAIHSIQRNSYLQMFGRPPLLSSHRAGWRGIDLNYCREPAGEVPEHFFHQCHLLCIETILRPCAASKWMDGQCQNKPIVKGDVFLIPEQVRYRERWEGEIEFISLLLDSTFVEQIAQDSPHFATVELLPLFPQPDPLIYQLGLALKTALETEAVSLLYTETLASALVVHLLQHYSAQKITLGSYKGGLSKSALKQIVQYIHAHLEQNLSLTELAVLAQMSCHHFARLFKRSTGVSPHQYVIQCRVERAKKLILQEERSIAEIAHQLGFANQSHLSRHFKRLVGVSPKQWLKQ